MIKAGLSKRRLFHIGAIFFVLVVLGLPNARKLPACGTSVLAAGQAEQMIALVGGTVIDGNGGAPIRDAVVVVKGNKIVQAGARGKTRYPASARVVDVSGKYVMPGLIDLHVHYRSWMGEMFLANGVTTVKDLGNDLEWISRVSEDMSQGRAEGPRIYYVGD